MPAFGLFAESSHKENWIFTDDEITLKRQEAYRKAQWRMENYLKHSNADKAEQSRPAQEANLAPPRGGLAQTPSGIKRNYADFRSGMTPLLRKMDLSDGPDPEPELSNKMKAAIQKTPRTPLLMLQESSLPADVALITIDQHEILVRYYEYLAVATIQRYFTDQINSITADSIGRPDEVADLTEEVTLRRACVTEQARAVVQTTVMFIKRFFLVASVMDFDPKLASAACFFLAAKVEEYRDKAQAMVLLTANKAATLFRVRAADLLDYEVTTLTLLQYHLNIFHPDTLLHRILDRLRVAESFFAPLQVSPDDEGSPFIRTAQQADALLSFAQHSDVTLLFTPGVIAFACVVEAILLTLPAVYQSRPALQEHTLAALGQEMVLQPLLTAVARAMQRVRHEVPPTPLDINDMTGRRPEKAVVERLLGELRRCRNPMKVPGTEFHDGVKGEILSAKERVQRATWASQEAEQRREASQLLGTAGDSQDGDIAFSIKRPTGM